VKALAARFAAALVLLLALLSSSTAAAHVIGLSRGDYTVRGREIGVEITARLDDAALAVPSLDANADRQVTPDEIARSQGALQGAFIGALAIEADGQPCQAHFDAAAFDAPDGLRVTATYACPVEPARLHLRFGFLDSMPSDHRHLATVHLPHGGDVDQLAVLARPDMDVEISAGASHGFGSLLRGGVEHILTGADHMAFLLALVLGGTLVAGERMRVGALVAKLTAFTVGHSASLAIATLGGFAPGARFVEPAVALSVAYVGAENLFTRDVSHRWMLTLPFGFVHGFAFAGGLLPLGLPREQLPSALFAFNLGVEGGQLAVLAVLLPPLLAVRKRSWYPKVARGLSALIVLAGVVWFLQRIVAA
jgi:hydrogenase/urease accessory protein HupE